MVDHSPIPDPGKKSVSLVLGSGGAKGLAHIGVIKYLQDHQYDIKYIAGSSIGALVGGIHASGNLDAYAEWTAALQKLDMIKLLDLSFDGGLFKGDKIITTLRDLIGEHDIETLPVGFTAVATDLSRSDRGREVWLSTGPLFDAIRASIAVPTLFSPLELNGRLLVDGGVVNPVPVAPTLSNHTDLTIAVDLNGPQDSQHRLGPVKPVQTNPQLARLTSFVDRFRKPATETMGFADIATRSMEAMQASITQFKLAATAPDILVSIPRNLCGFFDFDRSAELIEFGYRQAELAIGEKQGELSQK